MIAVGGVKERNKVQDSLLEVPGRVVAADHDGQMGGGPAHQWRVDLSLAMVPDSTSRPSKMDGLTNGMEMRW